MRADRDKDRHHTGRNRQSDAYIGLGERVANGKAQESQAEGDPKSDDPSRRVGLAMRCTVQHARQADSEERVGGHHVAPEATRHDPQTQTDPKEDEEREAEESVFGEGLTHRPSSGGVKEGDDRE